MSQGETGSGNRVLWGMWRFQVDLRTETIEIVPLREGWAHLNVVSLLEPVMLKYLTYDPKTLEVDFPEGKVSLDIILQHPLPGHPEYTGFDVRGIVISRGSWENYLLGEYLVLPGADETRLENADGYTRWWNPTEFTGGGILGYKDGLLGIPNKVAHFTSTVNGYKYFADGLGANDEVLKPLVLVGRGRFSCSSTNRRHYSLNFGPAASDFMVFNYAVDASWERPANIPPQSFDDFPISANALEPFNIDIQEEANSLYFDPQLEDCPVSGGVLRLRIDVATWQGAGGIDRVLIGSPDLGVGFFPATEVGASDVYSAHISTFTAELVPDNFETYDPLVLVAATGPLGSYTAGPEKLPISFEGSEDAPLALYEVFEPYVGTNSPPQVGPVTGPIEVTAGEVHTYNVETYYDCQDLNEDLVFAWEIGDDSPPEYNNGMGNIDGIHPFGNGSIDICFPDEGSYAVDTRVKDLNGTFGYSEAPLMVDVKLPEAPQFPPSGLNLTLSLKRTVLHSYEYINNPSDIPAIVLSWDGSQVSGVVNEWAVYRDDDPYDDLEEWKEIGTTPPAVWSYANMLSGQSAYNSGGSYYFKVKARSVAGNKNSESVGSTEWAFIEFENAEVDGASEDKFPWSMGYGGNEQAFYRQFERPGYGGAVSGGCWMMDPDSDYMRQHIWSVIASPPLPVLTDPVLAATTEEWYIELIFGAQVTPMNECWDNFGRLSVGTVPDDPSLHNKQQYYYEYGEARPADYMEGTSYYTAQYFNNNNSRFDETPATYNDRYGWGRNEYGWPFNWARYRLTDLNPNGVGRVRAAIGFGSGATPDAHARPRADEIAVIIY